VVAVDEKILLLVFFLLLSRGERHRHTGPLQNSPTPPPLDLIIVCFSLSLSPLSLARETTKQTWILANKLE